MKMTYQDMIEWAHGIQERDAINEAQRQAKQKADDEKKAELDRQYRTKKLNEFLADINLPLEVEEDLIRFGDYELRAGGTRSSGFGLRVWAPAPYDMQVEPWEDDPGVKQGEMADANVDIGYSSDLASWLLNPTTNFPPERKPKPDATEHAEETPAYIPPPPPPPSTAEHLVKLIGQLIDDRVDHRFEQLESSIDHLGSTIDNSGTRRDKTISDLQYRLNEQRTEIEDLRYRK